jgi:hypothetical protein
MPLLMPRAMLCPWVRFMDISPHALYYLSLLMFAFPQFGLWFGSGSQTSVNLNLMALSVWFRFGEGENLNRTERTVWVGSGLGLEIFPNWTDSPVRGSAKCTPELDRTEPQQH